MRVAQAMACAQLVPLRAQRPRAAAHAQPARPLRAAAAPQQRRVRRSPLRTPARAAGDESAPAGLVAELQDTTRLWQRGEWLCAPRGCACAPRTLPR